MKIFNFSDTFNKLASSSVLTLSIVLIFISCGRNKSLDSPSPTIPRKNQIANPPIAFQDSLSKIISEEYDSIHGFLGISIVDAVSGKDIFSLNDNKYFIPASNTKLFTYYTALNILGYKLPALAYRRSHDSLIIKGTGYPILLHPYLKDDGKIFKLLSESTDKIYLDLSNFQTSVYGSGWAWDDTNYSYQRQISSLPIYGNVLWIGKESDSTFLKVDPPFFKSFVSLDTTGSATQFLQRIRGNDIEVNCSVSSKVDREVPIYITDSLLIDLLSDTLGRRVDKVNGSDSSSYFRNIMDGTSDSLYKKVLVDSDNFISEQLLIMCSHILFDTLSTRKVIDFSKENIINGIPDVPRWVDGSGLSRYNLMTPRSLTWILNRIYRKSELNKIKKLFPRPGGGSLSNLPSTDIEIYAKSGSLSNNYNLSGYLITQGNDILYFSIMNNHYMSPSSEIRKKVIRLLKYVATWKDGK